MVKKLDQKVIFGSAAAFLAVVLLAASSIGVSLDLKRAAEVQARDAQQAAFNADFDVALVRAAGEAASFAITNRKNYRDEANEALQQARAALNNLRAPLGDHPSMDGLEGKHLGFIKRQREVLRMVERGVATALELEPNADQAKLDKTLDVVYAYEPLAGPLRREIAEHGNLKRSASTLGVRDHSQNTIDAAIASVVVLASLIGMGLLFTRRLIVKPISCLADAARIVAAREFSHRVAVTSADEIGDLQIAFNRMVGELHRSHERLSLALENSDTAIWDWNVADNVIYLSEAWSVMLGGPRQETFTSIDALTQLVHPSEVDGVRQAIVMMFKGDTDAYRVEHRVKIGDGDWKWIVSRGKVVERGPDGRALRAIGTNIDITHRKQTEENLRHAQGFLDSIVEHIPDMVFVKEAEALRCVLVNRAGKHLFDFTRQECLGTDYQDFFPSAQAEVLYARDRDVLASKQPLDIPEESTILPNGQVCVLHTKKIPILDAQGNAEYLLTISQDITQRKQAEHALRGSEERFRLIAENVSDLIAVVDTNGKRIYNSPSYRALFGADVLLPGSDSFAQIHLDDREQVVEHFQDTVKTGQGRPIQFRFTLPDGNVRFIESQGNAVRSESGAVDKIIVVSRDVTERLSADERLRHLAHHDLLTDLPNRVLMRDRIEQALMQAQRMTTRAAILFIDLDHFKNVNDLLGHTVGDQLLREVAQRLKRCVRESDTVSRQGGDEFIVLLPSLSMRADAVSTAEKILDAFAQPFTVGSHTLEITASVGLSIYPDDGIDAETLQRNADTAMYRAKATGRHGYQFFNLELEHAVRHRVDLGKRLREAIDQKEFTLHYQPRIDLKSGRVSSVEALVRWEHPELGLIGPMQFIPYAEESGLIVHLGKWILREACRQNEAWQRSGYPHLRVAVNVSGRQFRQHDFVNVVSSILAETGMAADALELELTETVFMQEAEHTKAVFERLRKMDVQVAIDDFGIGYSNLSYLKRFGVDRLKIDQSFVRDITTDRNNAAIVNAIMAMARSLQIEVTAEGVETEQQLHYLREQGCSEGQGFLFSHPLPAAELEQRLKFGWISVFRKPASVAIF